MSRIAIITDSSSGLSAELIARHDLHVLPYYIVAGGRMLRDGIQISREEVFRLLHDGRHLPTTKAPAQEDFAALFRSLLGKVDAALVILPPRERTAAYQHADSARLRIADLPITLIDSRHTSAGQALVVLAAARARAAGGDLDTVIAEAQRAADRMEFWIVLESLRFAARSGRVPNIAQYQRATRFQPSTLSFGSAPHSPSALPPVAGQALRSGTLRQGSGQASQDRRYEGESAPHVSVPVMRHENGAPHVAFTARSADQAIERLKAELVDRVSASGDASHRVHAAITHTGDAAQAESIRAWAQSTWSPVEMHVLEIPPVIAVYSGPGAIGVAVYAEPHPLP